MLVCLVRHLCHPVVKHMHGLCALNRLKTTLRLFFVPLALKHTSFLKDERRNAMYCFSLSSTPWLVCNSCSCSSIFFFLLTWKPKSFRNWPVCLPPSIMHQTPPQVKLPGLLPLTALCLVSRMPSTRYRTISFCKGGRRMCGAVTIPSQQ